MRQGAHAVRFSPFAGMRQRTARSLHTRLCPAMVQVQTKMQKQHLEKCTAVRPPAPPVGEEDDNEEGEEEEEDEEQLAEIKASEVGSSAMLWPYVAVLPLKCLPCAAAAPAEKKGSWACCSFLRGCSISGSHARHRRRSARSAWTPS